jgi:hypothetical protein
MKNRARAALAAGLFLLIAPQLPALSPSLAGTASSWFEASFTAGWSPSRGSALIGWRIAFRLEGMPVALAVNALLDDAGGYATADAIYYLAPSGWPDSVAVPLSAGLGLSRRGTEVSLALDVAGGAGWYPVSFSFSAAEPWTMGVGAEASAAVYLTTWGFEPVLAAHILVPSNLSAGE